MNKRLLIAMQCSALLAVACADEPPPIEGALSALEGEEEICPDAYDEATEHTCPHAKNGPYVAVNAAATVEAALGNINLAHTAYTVNLVSVGGQYQGAVRYRPAETTEHLAFIAPDVPFVIYDASGALVEPSHEQEVNPVACDPAEPQQHLVRFGQYSLDSAQTYRVFFGPTAEPTVLILMEHIEEFAGICEGCERVDLDASVSYWPFSWEDGTAELDEPIVFELPERIEVVEGNAGQQLAFLSYEEAETGRSVYCWYRGSATVPIPRTPEQIASGDHYAFLGCSNGAVVGDDVETSSLRLQVLFGGNPFRNQRTAVELVIEPECGGHDDHDDEHEGEAP